jgi:hypothetical protein
MSDAGTPRSRLEAVRKQARLAADDLEEGTTAYAFAVFAAEDAQEALNSLGREPDDCGARNDRVIPVADPAAAEPDVVGEQEIDAEEIVRELEDESP